MINSAIIRGRIGAWCLLSALCASSPAGDLDPPEEPSSTRPEAEPRTPISELPYSVTRIGSYYLTQDLRSPAGGDGITVLVDHATIDLNGFSIVGGGGTGDAITVPGPQRNVVVMNGTIHDWSQDGIDFLNTTNCQVRDVRLSAIRGNAIVIGDGGLVTGCTVDSSFAGIITGTGVTVTDCNVIDCDSTGFGVSGTVSNCTSFGNAVGFSVSAGATLTGCTAQQNTGDGFQVQTGCTFINCTSMLNGGDGFQIFHSNLIQGCNIQGSGEAGILVLGNNNRIDENNITAGQSAGIILNDGENIVIRNSLIGNASGMALTGTNIIGPLVTSDVSIDFPHPWANFVF